ncbi:MAG TPA: FAD-dependent oxidoreductase [Hydrogenophaga sp.]
MAKGDFEPYDAPSLDDLRARASSAAPVMATRRSAPGVVIVGGGRAGWQTAEALRGRDPELPITLVSACAADVYDKPLLSVAMARQIDASALVKETGADAAKRLGVRLLAQTDAIRIEPATRTLRTTRGNLRYGQLVLAHGANPALPPTLPAALCWRVNHLAAYQRLRTSLGDAPKEVVIVGAGLVGSELANDLALGGHRITLLDLTAQPLGRWPADAVGAPLLAAWKDLPIRFVGGAQVQQLEKAGERYRLTTTDGAVFEADAVIAATGLATPPRLAQGAGLDWNQGIAVEATTLRTSDPHIYALGDCVTIDGQSSRFIEPIARQAKAIAAAITQSEPVPFEVRPVLVRLKTTSLPMSLH